MFRPRYAYKSPIAKRYRGTARGCPVFNNIADINSDMVEQHDQCLECLAKIKNRNDLYKTLASNKRPNNNVIKSLQRLSSSASNNRLKTCLQFLIIRNNEPPNEAANPNSDLSTSKSKQRHQANHKHNLGRTKEHDIVILSPQQTLQTKLPDDDLKTIHSDFIKQNRTKQRNSQQEDQQLASPPQVSSTQDQIDSENHRTNILLIDVTTSPNQAQSSPSQTYASTTTTSTTTSKPNSHLQKTRVMTSSKKNNKHSTTSTSIKRRKIAKSSDHDTSSTTSWSSSYTPSPESDNESKSSSCSSSSSTSSTSTTSSATSSSESSSLSSSTCVSPESPLSTSPSSTPDIINDLRGPRLKLSEDKIKKIQKRPLTKEDFEECHSLNSLDEHSKISSSEIVRPNKDTFHMFQAPPKFVNNLQPCNLNLNQQPSPPQPTKELLRCAICGVKEELPAVNKIYGQYSCILCAGFFTTFIKRPKQLYCDQDGDCLMTVDSRCHACWIKICLQKFEIDDECRKVGLKYSPKLSSSPNVSLITIDTSLCR